MSKKSIALKKVAQRIAETLEATPEAINDYLVQNVSVPSYEDEEDVHDSAFGALVLHEAKDRGFLKAFMMLLECKGISYKVVRLTEKIHGLEVEGKVFSPYAEKLCQILGIDYDEWLEESV